MRLQQLTAIIRRALVKQIFVGLASPDATSILDRPNSTRLTRTQMSFRDGLTTNSYIDPEIGEFSHQ